MKTFNDLVQAGQASTAEALALFDSLEGVDLNFMFGRWQGSGLQTGHQMDGLLEHFNWYGKAFHDADHVDPLLFGSSESVHRLNPGLVPMSLATKFTFPKNTLTRLLFLIVSPLLRTRQSRARIRMTEYRGKLSATMVYDQLPINDVFRKVDGNTLLGVMDLKGVAQPFFFVLRREAAV